MADIEPSGPSDRGVSVWVVVAVAVGAVSLLAVAVFLVSQSLSGSGDTTLPGALDTTTTGQATTTARPATTSVEQTTTTTSTVEPADGFLGLWERNDPDGSVIRFDYAADGTVGMVDNKAMCEIAGYDDVFATGTGTFVSGPASSVTVEVAHTMDIYCYPADVGRLPLLESFEFPILYDPDSDMFLDGSTRVTEDNPFVGPWDGTDVDGSALTMTIRASGVYQQSDTSSTTCARVGLDNAPWASYGWAEFDLESAPKAFLTGTNVCFDADGNPVVSAALTDSDWFWSYQAEDDTIIFSADGATLARAETGTR